MKDPLSLSLTEENRVSLAASTYTFSDTDEMCSSRETSPLQLLDELLLKSNKDERRAISPGHVKEQRQLFERRSVESPKSADKQAALTENQNISTKSSMEKLKDILSQEKLATVISPGTESDSSSVSKPTAKPPSQAGLATNSASMSSSFTESQSQGCMNFLIPPPCVGEFYQVCWGRISSCEEGNGLSRLWGIF